MPYFFILPAFAILLLALVAAAIGVRFLPRLKHTSGYIVGGTAGTLVGFVVVNLLVWFVGLLPVWIDHQVRLPDWLRQASGVFIAGTLLIGPFIGSALGVAFGFAAGLLLVYVHRRRRNSRIVGRFDVA